jgi:murein DD-endopeptidase MepM/ murein hydrolase activator NlpD
MAGQRKIKLKDNSGGFAWFWLITLVVAVGAACNLPVNGNSPQSLTPEAIVWWTNTPDPNQPIGSGGGTPLPTTEFAVATPTLPPTASPDPETDIVNTDPFLYYAQAGDTLYALAVRFSVLPSEIESPESFPEDGHLRPGQLFVIPRRLVNTTTSEHLLPDSEVIFSPSAISFDIPQLVSQAGGYLASYRHYLGSTGWTSGAAIIERVATDNSINPVLLLSLLEYQSGWYLGQPANETLSNYPQLSIGYYGWREGLLTEVAFRDGSRARLSPDLNAGTVAIMYYFAQLYDGPTWLNAIDPQNGFPALHAALFGDYRARASSIEPLFPTQLDQPDMILPFAPEQIWSYSGGPHGAWGKFGARAALDFAPGSVEPGCAKSDNWVVAAAPGLVVRTAPGVLVLDLDGDGQENTGWALLYLHIATQAKIPEGSWVTTGQFLGNPSCEGGFSTGTHIHIARKYNGEWIQAGGPLPFNLSGWVAAAGTAPYEGSLAREGVKIIANPFGTFDTRIVREKNEP